MSFFAEGLCVPISSQTQSKDDTLLHPIAYQLPSGVPFTPENAEVMPKRKF